MTQKFYGASIMVQERKLYRYVALQIVNLFQYYGWNTAQYIVGVGDQADDFQTAITSQFNSLGWTLRTAYFNDNTSTDTQLDEQFADVLNYPSRCTIMV